MPINNHSRSFPGSRSQRTISAIVLAAFLLLLLSSYQSLRPTSFHLRPLHSSDSEPTVPVINPTANHSAAGCSPAEKGANQCCAPFANAADVVIIVKTGANEIYNKLPSQLLTSLQCFLDILIFSDRKQQIGSYPVHDALDAVIEEAKVDNPDFDYYRTLQQYSRYGQDFSTLGSETATPAWNLDKYKFIPMLYKTWHMRPDRKWYVFIEADTYLVRSNLLLWLDRLNSSEPLYLGSPTALGDEIFAHGGSGIVLSRTTLSHFAQENSTMLARYDLATKDEQFGDYVLKKALAEKNVALSGRWPLLQGEKPSTIPFGPGPGINHWCQPIVTMHHITPDEANRIWLYEQQRPNMTKPLLMHELYDHFVGAHLDAERDDWYNLSDDRFYRAPGVDGDRQTPAEAWSALERDAHRSFEQCGKACAEEPLCYQYVYHDDQTCGFSYSYRLGRRRGADEDGKMKAYRSGWDRAKIEAYRDSHVCDGPDWL